MNFLEIGFLNRTAVKSIMSSLRNGTYPVLPTTFYDDGTVDEKSFRRVLDYVLQSGVQGVVFPGIASECSELDKGERIRLTRIVGKVVGDRASFIVGASADTVADVLQFARTGAEVGAAVAMVMTPKGFEQDIQGCADFYDMLANDAQLPMMLQNAPKPTGLGLSVENLIAIFLQAPGIQYLKEETLPSGQRIEAIRSQTNGTNRGIFGGAGGRHIIGELNHGSIGTMPACELTEVHVKLVDAYFANKIDEAHALFERMLPILNMQAIFRWNLTKEVLYRRGLLTSPFVRAESFKLDLLDRRELTELLERIEDLLG